MTVLSQSKGQSLIETAVALPVLLLLLAGSYVCCRSAFLLSAAESAAHAEMLRAGRGLPGLERKMSESIAEDRNIVAIRSDTNGKSRLLPSPFPSLAGRTIASSDIRKRWEEAGGYADLPALRSSRTAEGSVDCWGMQTDSGKKVRVLVGGYVATGILR